MADQRQNAGNIGDIIKHSLLPPLIEGFCSEQQSEWVYSETHAGFYDYPLSLLKDGEMWKGERAWSIGLVDRLAKFNQLGAYGRELAKSFEDNVYPGSLRIVDATIS